MTFSVGPADDPGLAPAPAPGPSPSPEPVPLVTWKYEIRSGKLTFGDVEFTGYSGHGDGVNNPDFAPVPGVGPIPPGAWTAGPPFQSGVLGPYVLPLIPQPGTNTFGRSGFFVHGDEITAPGEHLASHGCIVVGPAAREAIWESGSHTIVVATGDAATVA